MENFELDPIYEDNEYLSQYTDQGESDDESLYEDDDYLSQFIDNEEVKKVSQIIEQEEKEDEDIEEISDWFTPDFKEVLESSRYRSRVDNFKNANINNTNNTRVESIGNSNSFTDDIVRKESGGNYRAVNPNSSATGKYQFLWGTRPGTGWQDEIKAFTGVRTKEEFLNNPEAQDKFYNEYYLPEELLPAVKRLKNKGFNMDTDKLAKLVHFRGEKGAADYLTGKASNQPEAYNMKTSDYIKQTGGYNYAQAGILTYDEKGKMGLGNTLGNMLSNMADNTQKQNNENSSMGTTNNNINSYSPSNSLSKTAGLNTQNKNINPDNNNLRETFSTPKTAEDKAMNVTSDTYDTKPMYGSQSEPLGINSNSTQQNNGSSDFSQFATKNQDAIVQGASMVQPLLDLGRSAKDFKARGLSNATGATAVMLGSQESNRKRIEEQDLFNLSLDKFNPNSNNRFKEKRVIG